jgi:hypothetical protein
MQSPFGRCVEVQNVGADDFCEDELVSTGKYQMREKRKARQLSEPRAYGFARVRAIGLTLPGAEAATKYDGSPVLRVGGVFVAGLATDRGAEPDTLVVRVELDERERLIEDAPDTYYVTDYHRPYPVVLVRLSRVDRDALHDLLSVSLRLALSKTRRGAAVAPDPHL